MISIDLVLGSEGAEPFPNSGEKDEKSADCGFSGVCRFANVIGSIVDALQCPNGSNFPSPIDPLSEESIYDVGFRNLKTPSPLTLAVTLVLMLIKQTGSFQSMVEPKSANWHSVITYTKEAPPVRAWSK